MKQSSRVFNENTQEYDQWFAKHSAVYQSEILAIQQAIPQHKIGIEIGVGAGHFAKPLNIKYGVEPSENMAKVAEQKGITVYRAFAENLPIDNMSFDFALMVTTVCFLSNIPKAFSEVHRILKPNGEIILAIIDKNSELGRKYEKGKTSSKFYSDAHFHSTEELTALLQQSRFQNFQYWQTLTGLKENEIEKPEKGYGQGSFVVIKANKV
jgi:ubiquinone/menaquinone biosynthesis C-methylase UbiE